MPDLHSLEAEEALIGSLLIGGRPALMQATTSVSMADFYHRAHAHVFESIVELASEGQTIDGLLLAEKLRSKGHLAAIGGPAALMRLDQAVPTAVNVLRYAATVREMSVRRRVVAEAELLVAEAHDLRQPIGDALARSRRDLAGIVDRADTFRRGGVVAAEVIEEINKTQEGRGEKLLKTGIEKLDRAIGGLPALPIVLGGRPGSGKSAVLATILRNVTQAGHTVALFSLEDRASWVLYRWLSAHSGVPNFTLRFRKLDDAQHDRAGTGFAAMQPYQDRLLVDDRRGLRATDIAQAARNMVLNHGAELVVVDHWGEVKRRGDDRHDIEIGNDLRLVRDMAYELGVPLVVAAQLSRKAEEDKRPPRMSDFKNSGEIEEISRVAIAVTRDADKIQLHLLKNTNGVSNISVEVEFQGAAAMVESFEAGAEQAQMELGNG